MMFSSKYIWIYPFVILAVLYGSANAGDISGAPAMLPPDKDRNFYFMLSNDFLGRGGESDDFRTQQIGIQARLGPRWGLLFDHSILTANVTNSEFPGQSGRIDQISTSLMYKVYHSRPDELLLTNTSAGLGLRSYGNYGGNRIQNSFHRLIKDPIRDFTYIDESRDDTMIWSIADIEIANNVQRNRHLTKRNCTYGFDLLLFDSNSPLTSQWKKYLKEFNPRLSFDLISQGYSACKLCFLKLLHRLFRVP
jgi:hypothetical protein